MARGKLNTAQQTKVISKKPTGVFYIDRNKAFYFELSLSSPIALEIPTDILANFELMNKKKLTILLNNFIKSYNLPSKNIVLLLSVQVTFDKEFPHGSIEVQKNIQEFLELVPYEEILDKKIISSGKTKVVATNKEVCDALKQTFIAHGFLVTGIYPLTQVMESVPQLKQNLDLSLFVNKISDLKALNLAPVVEAAMRSSSSSLALNKDKSNKSRLILLVAVFAFLIVILGYVIYANVIAPGEEVQSNILPTPTIMPVTPTSIPDVAPVTEIPIEDEATLSGEIIDDNSTTGLN